MKQALQALIAEMEYVLSCINEDKIPFDGDDFHEALRLGKEALAQPEQRSVSEQQEPVAHMNQHGVIHEAGYPWEPTNRLEPLYTTPPQRKPLSDEEIILIVAECASSHQHTDIHLARAIEAAHGIKE